MIDLDKVADSKKFDKYVDAFVVDLGKAVGNEDERLEAIKTFFEAAEPFFLKAPKGQRKKVPTNLTLPPEFKERLEASNGPPDGELKNDFPNLPKHARSKYSNPDNPPPYGMKPNVVVARSKEEAIAEARRIVAEHAPKMQHHNTYTFHIPVVGSRIKRELFKVVQSKVISFNVDMIKIEGEERMRITKEA